MYVNNNLTYFDIFGVKHIPNKTKIGNKHIITNIYRIQAYDSMMCVYFYIGFIDFILKAKLKLDYANCVIVTIVVSIENLKILKYETFPKKH